MGFQKGTGGNLNRCDCSVCACGRRADLDLKDLWDLRGYSEKSTLQPKLAGFLEQEAHELLESRDFLPVRPERHDILEVVELAHVPSFPIRDCAARLKGVIQRFDLSKPVLLNIL